MMTVMRDDFRTSSILLHLGLKSADNEIDGDVAGITSITRNKIRCVLLVAPCTAPALSSYSVTLPRQSYLEPPRYTSK